MTCRTLGHVLPKAQMPGTTQTCVRCGMQRIRTSDGSRVYRHSTDHLVPLLERIPMPDQFDADPWYSDHRNLALLAEQMIYYGDIDSVTHMLEKPWHYDPEWAGIKSAHEGERAAAADAAELRGLRSV